jgi:hypothetical protein
MRNVLAIFTLTALAGAFLFTAPAHATEFKIFGAYADTDVLGDTGGGGIGFGIPFNDTLSLDLRATYLQELSSDPLDGIFDFDDDNDVFADSDINVVPIDVGLRFNFQRGGVVNPYIGGGGTYFILDSDARGVEIDDELGFYGLAGARFGDDVGPAFFAEAMYRTVEASASFRDDDVDFDDDADIDLDGFAVNAGIVWTF